MFADCYNAFPNLAQQMPNEALHRPAIPLCSIAAGVVAVANVLVTKPQRTKLGMPSCLHFSPSSRSPTGTWMTRS